MADMLSKGSNSSTFKNVSIDIGVIGMQGKATETRKTVILTTETKQKAHYQITLKNKKQKTNKQKKKKKKKNILR